MTTILLTRRALDAEQHTTATAFGAVRAIAPNVADRLDEATMQLAAVEDDLAYVNEKLRRLHPPAVFRENVVGQRSVDFELDMDEIERRVAIADLEREQVETSRRVKDARKHVEAVRQEAANVLLHRGGADWQDRAATMVAARGDVERKLARFVESLMIYAKAVNAERAAARTAQAIARQALTTDEARDALLFAAKTGEVPVAINDDGFADTVDRPEIGLYGDETIDFRSLARLLELAFTDPERAAKQLNGTTLGNAIRKQTR
jgi:hypothetical protein